jgi:3-methyladenine DNA glycosylase AlkD
MNTFHHEILDLIIGKSGKGTQHTFLDSYLGNTNPRYPINAPALRLITKTWMAGHKKISVKEFSELLSSLIKGKSSTEKMAAGMLLGYSPKHLRQFNPGLFDKWLNELKGWAEVDAVCTGPYTITEIPKDFAPWEKILVALSKSTVIEKRRASLVLLCSPISQNRDDRILKVAFENINRLKDEKEVLITKAISWLLRSAVKHHKKEVDQFVKLNIDSLPKIAVRETLVKLKTGKKTKSKPTL